MGLLEAGTLTRIIIIVSLFGVLPAAQSEPATAPDEYEVKAAFLVGFARFMEHPEAAAVVLCTAGDNRMSEVLKRTAAGKMVADKPISVRIVDRKDSVAGCSLIFVGPHRLGLIREIDRVPGENRLLTVGDGPGFLDSGGAIEFTFTCNKIQFNASLAAIQRSGVKVNSRLLTLARNLRQGGCKR